MKRRLAIVIVSALVILCALFPLRVNLVHSQDTASITLADAINACTLNWTADPTAVKFAMVFNALPLSYYDTLIQQYVSSGDWLDVFQVKRFSEIDGYDSPTIERATQEALSNMPMLENLPLTWNYSGNPYYMVYYRFMLDAYRYAAQYGQTAIWDKNAAYQELLATYLGAGQPSIAYNPVTNTTFNWTPRYYDEAAETLDSLVKLGGNDAGLWNYIQNHFWNGSIYGYNGANSEYECEVGFFAFVIGYYYALSGYSLANFDRVYLDLYNKLLISGWSSAAWGVPGVLQHASGNPQLRIENTLGAIQALQAYCGSSTWQSSFVNLLSGSNPAWEALLASSMYSAGRFKFHSDGGFSDDGTAAGMMTLFLEGIIPETGTLAMPLDDESYQDICGLSPASLFGFDYSNSRIRIPVNPGGLEFQFGTKAVTCRFPSAGVYDVQFDSTWNTVTNVTKVGPLDNQFQYLESNTSLPTYYPSSLGETSVLTGSNSTFYCDWAPNVPLSGFMLSDNNSGTMINETWTSFNSLGSGNSWSNCTIVLNSSSALIQWLFYANDTSNNWNQPMALQYVAVRPGIHDIAVTNVVSAKTIVGQGFPLNISVTVANFGEYPEFFNVTAYANMTAVDAPSRINLAEGDSVNIVFTWNTSGWAEGNYVLSAYAGPVPGEINIGNNNYTGGIVTVAAHDVSIAGLELSEQNPTVNDTLTISVILQNNGGNTENFSVSVNCTFVNESTIGTQTLILAPEEDATLNFTWTPKVYGFYTINAYTSEIKGDPSPNDNTISTEVFVAQFPMTGGAGGRMPYLD